MKIYFTILFAFIGFSLNLIAQNEGVQVKLSLDKRFDVDSVVIKKPPLNLHRLNKNQFNPEQVLSPEKTLQAFISITNKNWGRLIVTNDYPDVFPDEQLLHTRNSEDYKKNAYLKIYTIIYFESDTNKFAACLFDTYVNKNYQKYQGIMTFQFLNNKWLVTNNWYLSRIKDLNILKQEYISELFKGTSLKGNGKYNDLFEKVYKNGVLDLFLFNSQGAFDKNYYSELLNKY